MKSILISCALAIFCISCSQPAAPAEENTAETEEKQCCKKDKGVPAEGKNIISDESVYLLDDTFTTQQNKPFVLSQLKGKPVVVGMVFTHCAYACPRLTADIKNISASLKDKHDKVNFLLVSFDVERDIPKRLIAFANEMDLPETWTLLHGNEDAVRTLSVLLNVQYEKNADGSFNHSNLVSVLDKDGVLIYQKEGLEAEHSQTLETIKNLLN